MCSSKSNQQFSSIGSDNGLAPARRQAIIWTSDGKFTNAYIPQSAPMSQINHVYLSCDVLNILYVYV